MGEDDELNEDFLSEIKGGLNYNDAVEMAKSSKFKDIKEMAKNEEQKMEKSDINPNMSELEQALFGLGDEANTKGR